MRERSEAEAHAPDVLVGARELWDLDPDVVHLNAGAWGAIARPVREEQARLRERAARNPHRFNEWEVFESFDESRQVAARLLGAPPHDIAFLPNATTAMATAFASLPLAEGDEVLLTEHVYETVATIVERAATRNGASVVTAPLALDLSDDEIVEQVVEHVTERTRVAVLDHAAAETGVVLPVAELARRLRERGVLVVVDGANAVATMPLAVEALGVDVWIGSFNKWLGAPPACAGMYVAPPLQDVIEPLVASHFFSMGFPHSFGFQGSAEHTARLCIPAAVAVYEGLGWERVWEHAAVLARAGADIVAAVDGMERVRAPAASTHVTAVRLPRALAPDLDAGWRLANRLGQEQRCEVAVAAPRGDVVLRLGVHPTNTLDDFVRLADGLRAVLHR